MPQGTLPGDWQTAVFGSYEQLMGYLLTYLPQIFGAVLLLLIGWLVAFSLSRLTLSLLSLGNRLLHRLFSASATQKRFELKPSHVYMASRVVFWLVMLFFIAASTSVMGLDFFATWLGDLLSYLPRVLAGILIILGGYLLGSALGVMSISAAESAGFERAYLVGTSVQMSVLFTAAVIGIEQLGINIQFVTQLFTVVSGVIAAGVALAFGLGAKTLVANIIGARHAQKYCRSQDHIQIAGIEGKVAEINSTMMVIETDQGRVMIPAKLYLEQISQVRHPVDKTVSKS